MTTNVYYNIEKILDRKKIKNKFFYKIKWEGYPMDQCTWEPIENLQNAIELVEEFNNTHPIKTYKKTKEKNQKLLNKKRKGIETEKLQENVNQPPIQNNNNIPNNIEEKKDNINENKNILSYNIDNSLKNVSTVRKQNEKLMAVVEKMKEKGEIVKVFISTEDLRKSNPWILLDFYESKIKFN